VLYVVNYIDRTNLAYAAVGMSRTSGFSDRVFGLGAGIFFISYLALQITGARMVERFGARRVISSCMVTWGSITVLTALVHTPIQLYGARFVLGAAEAGFFPGVIVYLSYVCFRQGRAIAIKKPLTGTSPGPRDNSTASSSRDWRQARRRGAASP